MKPTLPFDPSMIATTDTLPGYEVTRVLGVVEGFGSSEFAALGSLGFLLRDLAREAYLDMMQAAARQGAQAIVGLRYALQEDDAVLVYGTAVTVRALDYRAGG